VKSTTNITREACYIQQVKTVKEKPLLSLFGEINTSKQISTQTAYTSQTKYAVQDEFDHFHGNRRLHLSRCECCTDRGEHDSVSQHY